MSECPPNYILLPILSAIGLAIGFVVSNALTLFINPKTMVQLPYPALFLGAFVGQIIGQNPFLGILCGIFAFVGWIVVLMYYNVIRIRIIFLD